MVDGIEIDKEVAEETLLPDDLNSLAVGSYVVPDPRKSCLLYTSDAADE